MSVSALLVFLVVAKPCGSATGASWTGVRVIETTATPLSSEPSLTLKAKLSAPVALRLGV